MLVVADIFGGCFLWLLIAGGGGDWLWLMFGGGACCGWYLCGQWLLWLIFVWAVVVVVDICVGSGCCG